MKLSTNSVIFFISCTIRLINSNFTDFNYERMHRFGLGRRIIPNYRRLNPSMNFGFDKEQRPAHLPVQKNKKPFVLPPYHTIYQGTRKSGDFRVYNDKFENSPLVENGELSGKRYFCKAVLNCIINFLAVRTNGGIPILLRGGVGYRHFYVIARAHGDYFNGSVQVYCMRSTNKEGRR